MVKNPPKSNHNPKMAKQSSHKAALTTRVTESKTKCRQVQQTPSPPRQDRHLSMRMEGSTPQLAELPRRRLQEGSSAAGTTIVRPKRSSFSPRNFARGEERGGMSDAFNKVIDARSPRHHLLASKQVAFARIHRQPQPGETGMKAAEGSPER